MILAMGTYSFLMGRDGRGYAPAPPRTIAISLKDARAAREEFDALAATHTEDEFQILNSDKMSGVLTTIEPEPSRWTKRLKQVKSLFGGIVERSRSGLEMGWAVATGLVDQALSNIRAYAWEYQQKRSTSLVEDILLSVFSNGLSQFLFAFFGAVFGVMVGRRRKRTPTTE